ncbi:transglycosylase domain-containing protein [Allobranchiibius sp. CTAmp26]|uniref:transglycosylase domain-containing protein n=1 Tax=Allobranchiibius sp. CTAmp26 TaxID=2815214 RepID=UPI001AA125CF|nr:transglycosylase domain-containing protein [Allobranchiibius sp. CTAmp26]MBO1756287.1 penicillin-binding protein [Allobranchiibius sp. CTAmp26]
MSDEGPVGPVDGDSVRGQDGRQAGGGSARPPRGRGRRRRGQHGLFFKVVTRTIVGLFALFLIGVVALVVIYERTAIPQPGQDAGRQVAVVYYSDGKTELGRIGPVNRQNVQLSQVPQKVQYAFLSAEDRNFYDNKGISPTGILRAAWADARGGSQQGGSTITQQYVKNYFLTQDRTVTRKVKEIMISIKIDQKYTKQQILVDYLNTIYFGRNAYGIQAASQAYFGVDSSKLTVSQGAFLASVINAPAYFDPANGADSKARASARMAYVFDGMVKKGWLSQAEASAQTFPVFKTPKPANTRTGSTGYLLAAIENELSTKLKLTGQDIGRSGLRITSTIDKTDQAAAVQAVKNSVSAQTASTDQVHAGLLSQKTDGAVVAMYGGADYQKTQFSSATQAAVPGGSSFKVFALTAAQQQGIGLNTQVSGANYLRLPGVAKPITNDRGETFGLINLRTALADSVNTAFVRLNVRLGSGKTLAAAKLLGIPATDSGMNTPTPNDTLGVADVHVIDLANAYNTINAGGERTSPYFVQKVTSEQGGYSYTAHPDRNQVVSKDIANNVASAMAGPITYPTGSAHATLRDFGRPAAGKTGTVGSGGKFRSAWFTGFTPGQLTTSVGMYAGDGGSNTSLAKAGQQFYGGVVPTQIWKDYMTIALRGKPITQLPKATNAGSGNNIPTTSTTSTPTTTTPTSTSTTTSQPPTSTSTSTTPTPTSTTTTPTPTSTAPTTTATTTAPPTSTRIVVPTPTKAPTGPPTPGVPTQGAPTTRVAPPASSSPATPSSR